MSRKSWVIIANASRAKLYEIGTHKSMLLIKELQHPESRTPTHDLVSDRQGRTNNSVGVGRSAYEPETPPKLEEMVRFAKEIAKEVNSDQLHLEKLYIASSPAFLGLLRQELNGNLQKLIQHEVAKDLTHLPESELIAYFIF